MKRYKILSIVLLCSALLGCRPEVRPLTFVIIPAEEASLSKEQFAPFVEYLSGELGQEIRLLVVADYTAVVEAMKYGHADVARFGPFNYVLATQEAEVEAIAAGIKKKTGKPDYRSLIVARADRGITDINSKSFAYVDVASASGYLVPATYIKKQGVEFAETFFAGSHSAVIAAVKNGTVDAGAIADNRYYVALEEGIIAEGELVVLWESEPIPNSPIAVQKSMEARLKQRLLAALLDAPREVVEQCGVGEIGYALVSDGDYDIIREIQEVLDLKK